MFDFFGDLIDDVVGFFTGDLLGAVAKTAAGFIIGGPSGQQQTTRQPTPQSKVHTGVATSRVARPDVPGTPGVADVDAFHAEWLARMSKFVSLASITDTGSPRTLGTQARRN